MPWALPRLRLWAPTAARALVRAAARAWPWRSALPWEVSLLALPLPPPPPPPLPPLAPPPRYLRARSPPLPACFSLTRAGAASSFAKRTDGMTEEEKAEAAAAAEAARLKGQRSRELQAAAARAAAGAGIE